MKTTPISKSDPAILITDTLLRFAAVARPIMLDVNPRKDTCIRSTAITIGVLEHYGISAEPFPCSLVVLNPAFVARVEQEWQKGDKARSLGVDVDEADVGHVIALVERRYLVDTAIDQAERPEKSISLRPVLMCEIPESFQQGQPFYGYLSETGCLLTYYPKPEKQRWRTSPEWCNKDRHEVAIGRIVAAMESYREP